MRPRRQAEVKFASGFQLAATPKWNPFPDASSAPRRSGIRARTPAQRHADLEFASGYQLGATAK